MKKSGFLLIAFSLLFPACSSLGPRPTWINDQLYFGMKSPEGQISEAAWQSFVSEVVTPRFPDGLTAWEAKGQWKNSKGEIEREGSHVLQLLHMPEPKAEKALDEIVDEYKKRFRQESVLRMRSAAELKF